MIAWKQPDSHSIYADRGNMFQPNLRESLNLGSIQADPKMEEIIFYG